MNIFINGKQYNTEANCTIEEVRSKYFPESEMTIINAVVSTENSRKIQEGDQIYFIRKGVIPPDQEMQELLFSRQPVAITLKLKKACVGIAGAGGLGTVVAESLARAGIGKLVVADFDIIEPSNLNRQRYFMSQLGMPKVDALAENIQKYNPYTIVVPLREKVTATNCAYIFAGCSIVAECFDNAANKAELVFGLRNSLSDCMVVAASGLAGIGGGNDIVAKRISEKLYVVGDMVSDADDGSGLFASRVGIAASMQAHVIIRLILGKEI